MLQWDTLLPENKETPFGLTRFIHVRFGPVPPQNGNTDHTFLLLGNPITSDLLLLIFFL